MLHIKNNVKNNVTHYFYNITQQTTPKNLPRMQCARAIPVKRLGSGSCQPDL